MRPEPLFPLFASVTSLERVGPRLGKLIERVAGPHVVDLLWHLPVGILDRSFAPTLAEAPPGRIATVTITIIEHVPPVGTRAPWRVLGSDGTGELSLTFFHVKGDWVARKLPLGARRVVSGRIETYGGRLQMPHPDLIAEVGEQPPGLEPVYGLTAGLPSGVLRHAVRSALARAPDLAEWQDPALLARERWPSWRAALTLLHEPETTADTALDHPARRRLAYDELLADQLALALIRARTRQLPGRALTGDGHLMARALTALPFALTGAQHRAIAEITADMARPDRMLRLLQGDVGSGKTLVALAAMLAAVESGAQAALMAPTEILARQHYATLSRLAEPAGVRVALLTGREKGRTREAILGGLADGSTGIAIGTHALFQDDVAFRDLGLAVIDEQHKFGVEERVRLSSKGSGVDVLVMTATPIPRSLQLTAYGDLDASRLDEKPAGRQKIETRILPLDRLDELVAAIGRALANGAKAYWVCPLIEESETIDLAAVEARHQELSARFGARVGLVHGRMKPTERDAVMEGFARGGIDLLVATTVIEVGVDVPEATIMVVDHAERFGLAQLHQLRGRIGRGSRASTCILLYAPPLGATAKARLKILRETEDGFAIAEEDLRLRGAGEVLGTRQSGLPQYRVADPAAHADLIDIAHDEARLILMRDPGLQGPRGGPLRTLLYLFERDAAIRYLRSG